MGARRKIRTFEGFYCGGLAPIFPTTTLKKATVPSPMVEGGVNAKHACCGLWVPRPAKPGPTVH